MPRAISRFYFYFQFFGCPTNNSDHACILAVHFDDVKGLVQSHHIYLFLYRLLAMQMFRPRKKHASENHVFLVHGLFEFQ